RIWALAYWRPAPAGDPDAAALSPLPVGATMALAGLVAITVAAGVWPEPVMALAQDAARGLLDPSAYVLSVFPVEASQ
ncbi:MAG: Na+/H+ antiporter subunit D, partial [Alphaproteobacteria bacterium]|nr:Na+/H+ antiporter subunit D [Alphaproteobacteria bacterium]